MEQQEQWSQIKYFPDYSISTFGNIRNNVTDRFLKPTYKGEYYHVYLTNNKLKKSCKVHRLVALAFILNPENKSDVNHKDKNKLNNNLTNLEWMTRKENNIHRCQNIKLTSNKNKAVFRCDKDTKNILEKYNSIEEAASWAKNNNLTKNTHNGRNAIGNCITGLSHSAYGFYWTLEEICDFENEIWKQVIIDNVVSKFQKKYFVSNLGRFKNSQGKIMDNYKVNENGYIRVYIYNKTYALHRLIALAFIENTENKEQVNHIDGNKINNSVTNLEWVTNKENQIHKFQNGLGNNFTRIIGQYTLDNIFIQEFYSIASAAKEMNISKSNINGVLRKNRKTAGGYIWKYLD